MFQHCFLVFCQSDLSHFYFGCVGHTTIFSIATSHNLSHPYSWAWHDCQPPPPPPLVCNLYCHACHAVITYCTTPHPPTHSLDGPINGYTKSTINHFSHKLNFLWFCLYFLFWDYLMSSNENVSL